MNRVRLRSFPTPSQMWVEATVEIQGMTFNFYQGIDGDKGWQKMQNKVADMDKETLAETKKQMYAHDVMTLLPLKDKVTTLMSLGEAKVGEQAAVGILVARKDHRDVSLFFDKKTGLLLKSETRTKDVQGGGQEYTVESVFGDYKEVEGVQYAQKVTVKRDGKLFIEGENTEVTVQEKIDAATFAKPKE